MCRLGKCYDKKYLKLVLAVSDEPVLTLTKTGDEMTDVPFALRSKSLRADLRKAMEQLEDEGVVQLLGTAPPGAMEDMLQAALSNH